MLDKKTVKAAARGRWENIFRHLAPQLAPAIECSPRHAPQCPMPDHQGRGKDHGRNKFRLPANFRENGMAICTCGRWSDGFALLMALNRWTFAQCIREVGTFIGLTETKCEVLSTDTSKCSRVEGKLLFAGMRDVTFRDKRISLFCIEVQSKDSPRKAEFSGLLLKKALEASQARTGDNVCVELTGVQTCRSAKGTFQRKLFAVTRLPSDEETAKAQEEARRRSEECRRNIEALWSRSLPIEDQNPASESVRKYMASRGIDRLEPSLVKDLRAIDGLIFRSQDGSVQKWNGLLGAVRDLSGRLVCVHRTFLSDGKKAPVDTPKMLMSLGPEDSVAGCSIHIGEPDDVLCLAEGIETAASVVIGTGYPCWSCVSANGLKAVQIPQQVKMVFIFEDKDRSMTGQKAAAELRERLTKEGRIAVVCSISRDIPADKHGLDWNDILCNPQGESFPVRNPDKP